MAGGVAILPYTRIQNRRWKAGSTGEYLKLAWKQDQRHTTSPNASRIDSLLVSRVGGGETIARGIGRTRMWACAVEVPGGDRMMCRVNDTRAPVLWGFVRGELDSQFVNGALPLIFALAFQILRELTIHT